MRIVVEGNQAQGLRDLLSHSSNRRVQEKTPNSLTPYLKIVWEETEGGADSVTLDSVDSELERNILNMVGELVRCPISILRRAGEITSEREIRVTVSGSDKHKELVELGIKRGIDLTLRTFRPRWFHIFR